MKTSLSIIMITGNNCRVCQTVGTLLGHVRQRRDGIYAIVMKRTDAFPATATHTAIKQLLLNTSSVKCVV